MDWFLWMIPPPAVVLLALAVLCFVQPTVRAVVGNFLFFVGAEIKGWFYALHEKVFGPIPNVTVRFVPIDAAQVNIVRNGWSYADCPSTVWVRRKINNTLEIEVGEFDEKCIWYCFPGVDFYVGRQTGRIKKLFVKCRYIHNRGQWFRHSHGQTEWAKYYTSVVLAHIEVLKFSQYRRSHHPTLVGRIFKAYGENFFQEVL